MSLARAYNVASGAVSIGGTSATPALYGAAASGADFNIVGIKPRVTSAAGSPPSNTSILVQLCAVTGSVGGGASVTARPTGQSTQAAQSTWKSGSSALTGLTQGNVLWSDDIPYTAGGGLIDWLPQGFEVNVAASGLVAVYFTAGSAGSSCSFSVDVAFAE
jgi:hypothetical protein